MASSKPDFKKQFVTKFLSLQLSGLEQYAKYLNQQRKMYSKNDHSDSYKKYIEKEILRNDKKILSVKEKMK